MVLRRSDAVSQVPLRHAPAGLIPPSSPWRASAGTRGDGSRTPGETNVFINCSPRPQAVALGDATEHDVSREPDPFHAASSP